MQCEYWKIECNILFYSPYSADKEFLKMLAHKTKGRFHCAHEDARAIETIASGEQWDSKLNGGHVSSLEI